MEIDKLKENIMCNIIDLGTFSEALECNVIKVQDATDEIEDQFHRFEKEKPLSASEALYGFIGQITSSSEKIVLSSSDNCARIAVLVGEFCKKNNLQSPGSDWKNKIVK